MNCMKCGREIDENQVFCQDCLLDMEKYPVKPGTVVLLPKRADTSGAKKPHSRRRVNLSPEDQVKLLKKRLRAMAMALIVALALIIALCFPAVEHLLENRKQLPGQNYSAVINEEPVDGAAESE